MALEGAPSIGLDEKEAHLVSLLDGCCDWINAHRPQPNVEEGGTQVNYNASVEARIAGGWVRDKLLGMPSHDLDVSLSVMTGLNFAILFKAYLLQLSSSASSSSSSSNRDSAGSMADAALAAMSRITKISANPEQSKSLETATANILGLDLDFVNLRKEVYDNPATRIPTMTFGTPQEDAERRDITINTLFFNVKTRQVEDWTGMGLQDLRAGLVRTPLPPLTTFLDDPLRVLRCVRFASRLNYRLDDSITDCLTGKSHGDAALYADDPRLAGLDASTMAKEGRQLLREALMTKVSRERVGVEVDKMMAGPFPLLAHQNLALLGLYELVFHPSSASIANFPVSHPSGAHELPDPDASSRLTLLASQLVDALSQRPLSTMEGASVPQDTQAIDQVLPPSIRAAVPTQLRHVVADREQRRRLELASAFLAFEGWEIEEKKGKWAWCGDRVMMQGLKLGKNHASLPIGALIHSLALFSIPDQAASSNALDTWLQERAHLINALPALPDGYLSTIGLLTMLLRDKNVHNTAVSLDAYASLLLSMIRDLLQLQSQGDADALKPDQVVNWYAQLVSLIEEHDLLSRQDEKPILDGNELLQLLELKPGPMTPKIQNALLIWQFQRARAADDAQRKEQRVEAAGWIKEMWAQGLIVPEDQRAGQGGQGGKAKKSKQQQQR